jgi:RNA polymerase sigma-70 factor (ECF subfamily)
MSGCDAAAPCAGRSGYASISSVPAASADAIDLELLQRIAARDDSALAALYDRHCRAAYSLILRILRSPADADDVLQETFVRVWARADTYDSRLGAPAAWLIRIARNRAIDRVRARRVRADISVAPAERADGSFAVPEPETRTTPEHALHDTMTTRAVGSALAHLPAVQRELIEAAFFDGFTHHELAVRFGVPLGTVKTRIRTGLAALREHLEEFA